MALSQQARHSGLFFWVRAAGLTGLLVLGVGVVVWSQGLHDEGTYLAAAGGGLLVLALLFEARGLVRLATSRRAALGSNVVLQIALALVLVAGLNAFSFYHHLRLDWTRDRIFTIDPTIRQQLAGLRGETRIVVFQRQNTLGQLAEKPDNYDAAAGRKIVEKVKDLVEQFQDLGPRFRVEVLDIQEEDYQDRLAALKKEAPALGKAIENAPENSIFFYSQAEKAYPSSTGDEGVKVQRLSFHDVYRLDKNASQQAYGGRGNLVLRYQGIKPFANRVLNIDEKKPRVAVAVVHELLGLDNPEELGMTGTKKVLAARGFESKNIILKKGFEVGMPEPVVLTYDESKYERLEDEIHEADTTINDLDKELKQWRQILKDWQTRPLAELDKTDLRKRLDVERLDENVRREVLRQIVGPQMAIREMALKQERQERESAARDREGLNVENLSEQRRIADLRAKFNRMLADVDLLIVPRMTLRNVTNPNDFIPNWVHGLDAAQLEAIKDFMKAGKPVLFCPGPANESPNRPPPPGMAADHLEELLSELGIQMPRQTILFNAEGKAFAERRSGFMVLGAQTEVPPVDFDWKPGAGEVRPLASKEERAPNPVRTSLRLAARGIGKDLALDLRLRSPRPVYYEPPKGDAKADAVFMMTSPEAWNENQPFPTRDRVPRFQPPKPGDPDQGTIKEERRGQFPVAVAVETRLPASWYAGKEVNPGKVRLAVIGHGGVFSGTSLTPAKEKLLLDVSNWLLGRDDLLAREDNEPWSYPRVALTDSENALWQWGTRLGLPVLFVYLGLMVFMVRRMR